MTMKPDSGKRKRPLIVVAAIKIGELTKALASSEAKIKSLKDTLICRNAKLAASEQRIKELEEERKQLLHYYGDDEISLQKQLAEKEQIINSLKTRCSNLEYTTEHNARTLMIVGANKEGEKRLLKELNDMVSEKDKEIERLKKENRIPFEKRSSNPKNEYQCWNCDKIIVGDNLMSCPDCVRERVDRAVQKALSELRDFVGKTMSKNPMTKEEVGWNYACLRITEHIDKAIDSRRTA